MSQKNLPPGKSYTRKKIQNFSYGLNDAIGKGYSSQVYRGRNDTTEQPVAIKVIDLKMLKCEINRTLLASEIEILKSMKNIPHVLTLHEVYTTKNNTYIITQLCETDLSSKIKKGLAENEAFTFMNQIIQGYSYIYQRDLIHRDLKPANLLITKSNDIKIADFGFGVKAEEVLKPSKYNVGSPLYMAPESLKRNQYSFKSDIWALGIIFFEMLTGDTPWRAKNQKQLLKRIQGERITQILSRQKFNSVTKQFLTKALNQDKNCRLGPDELIKFNFKVQQFGAAVLGEKQMNTMVKIQKFQSIINDAPSPKNVVGRSIEKRIFQHQKSEKKLNQKTLNTTNTLQNMSLKNIENQGKNQEAPTPTTTASSDTMSKQDKKYVSKLLIAEVHFCRFLYKLLGRVKQSMATGLFKENGLGANIFSSFTQIIQNKVSKLRMFEQDNYLSIEQDKYDEYKKTSDYRKLVKIAKDYYDRYSSQLCSYWQPTKTINYSDCISQVTLCIQSLLQSLSQLQSTFKHSQDSQTQFLEHYSKDVVILDYLITCKQLLEMIDKQVRNNGRQNYQKFAKKSRIEEIVEGATSQIGLELFGKIIQRGRIVIGGKRQ